MRIAGYIRVSTAEQKLHGFSLTAQRELIERFCRRTDPHTESDEGISPI